MGAHASYVGSCSPHERGGGSGVVGRVGVDALFGDGGEALRAAGVFELCFHGFDVNLGSIVERGGGKRTRLGCGVGRGCGLVIGRGVGCVGCLLRAWLCRSLSAGSGDDRGRGSVLFGQIDVFIQDVDGSGVRGGVFIQDIEGGGVHGGAVGIVGWCGVLRSIHRLCHVRSHCGNIGVFDRGRRHMGSMRRWRGGIVVKTSISFEREIVLLVDHRRFTFITTSPICTSSPSRRVTGSVSVRPLTSVPFKELRSSITRAGP